MSEDIWNRHRRVTVVDNHKTCCLTELNPKAILFTRTNLIDISLYGKCRFRDANDIPYMVNIVKLIRTMLTL